MKCAIVFNNTIVNLIIVDEADVIANNIQQFAEVAGSGHTAEPLTAAQALTAWIGATRVADGWSEPVQPQYSAAELELRSSAFSAAPEGQSDLKSVIERQAKELEELRAQVAKIMAATSVPL